MIMDDTETGDTYSKMIVLQITLGSENNFVKRIESNINIKV